MRTIIIFSIIILRLCLRTRSYGDGQLDTSKLEQVFIYLSTTHFSTQKHFMVLFSFLKDEHGVTSLISSARFGNLTRVKEILRDANLPSSYKDHQDGSGQTALIAAVRNLHFLVAKYLISAGVNINIYDKEKMTALSCASSRGLTSIVVDLLDRGGDPSIPDQDGWIALTHASNNGHAVVVWYLLKTNVDVNQREPQDGLTPLCLASANGHDDVVKVLLQNGGLVNKTDRDLKTPLMHSVINGHGTIAKHLLEAGAHTDAISKKRGETALMFAAYTGNSEMVKVGTARVIA